LLTSILDAKITTNIVRLGTKTKHDRIAQYTLNRLERASSPEVLGRKIGREFACVKKTESEITRILNQIQLPEVTWEVAESFLGSHYPNHVGSFREPPSWIREVFREVLEDENEKGRWTRISKGREVSEDSQISGIYRFWKDGHDIEVLVTSSPPTKPEDERGDNPGPRVAFFGRHSFSDQTPPVPSECRSLECLTNEVNDVWSMSLPERKCLAELWEKEMRQLAFYSNLAKYQNLRTWYKHACSGFDNAKDEVSCRNPKAHSAGIERNLLEGST
jgi:hypothetical protein